MAFLSRKLAILLSYSYAPSSAPKSAIHNLRSIHVSGYLGNFLKRFSTVQEHSNPKILSHSPEKEVLKDQNMEFNLDFQIWHNGGGRCHKAALVDPTSVIETNALIHSEAVVGPDVHVGSGTIIGPGVTVGQSSRIGYNVVLTNCMVGDYCAIHNGACIGQDGFGFFVNEQGQMMKKPQNLKARIGNHVEIGANTCIDRGSWRDTTVGDHTKIDNLVQIGHNVLIGENCMLCGQVGIAGSVTIGDYVTLGGRVAIRDHVHIASKVRIAANSCVTKTIGQPGDYGGFPAVPIREWRKQVATLRQTAAKYSVKGA